MKKRAPRKKSINFNFTPDAFPTDPGCYLMKDSRGKVIYAGKAKNLKRRLSYYFRSRRQYYKTKCMVPNIYDVEVILVNNETESLILENNLIKHYKPRYNSMLTQDDVGYPFIVLTGEEYPRLLPYRRNWSNRQWSESKGQEDGKRFGPYLNKAFRDAVMDLAIETFGLRICRTLPKRVCLRYRLKKCSGLCEGFVSPGEYDGAVNQAIELLEYRHTKILEKLRNQMVCCSNDQDFEEAARLRDRITIIEEFLEKQIVERDEKHDQDILYFGKSHVMLIEIKKGMVLKAGFFKLPEEADSLKRVSAFITARCSENPPGELIINICNDADALEKQIFSNTGTAVKITIPENGIKKDLLMLCKKNYEHRLKKG